jgi:hypothetical protein
MDQVKKGSQYSKWTIAIPGILLITAFFIPWVQWDQTLIKGSDLPSGRFFFISQTSFKLSNPFPETEFTLRLFWLIPVLALTAILLRILNRNVKWPAILSGVLALTLVTAYILFTNVLADLGIKPSLQFGIYLTMLAAGGIILASTQGLLRKTVLLLIGPLVTWVGFSAASSYLENEEFGDTANLKADYTVNAIDLIREFVTNDTLANVKYSEKILTVNGTISAIENPNDSTLNIKFIDTASGSYAIFPFTGDEMAAAKKLKEGEAASIKASCSGGGLSRILRIHWVTFKRCTLNKN